MIWPVVGSSLDDLILEKGFNSDQIEELNANLSWATGAKVRYQGVEHFP